MLPFLDKSFFSRPIFIAILGVTIGIIMYLVGIPFLDQMELKTVDLRFVARGSIPAGQDVVLAVIDEKSIAKEGKWVWPRTKFIQLVQKLSSAGTKVVGFDVGFLDPDNRQVVEAISRIQQSAGENGVKDPLFLKSMEKLKHDSDYDTVLAETIAHSKSKVVLGYFFHMNDEETRHTTPAEMDAHHGNITGSQHKIVRYVSPEAQGVPLIRAYMPQSNIRQISNATDYSGFFNMFPDKDGVVRWIPAVIKYREDLFAPLALKSLAAFLGDPISVTIDEFGVESLRIGTSPSPPTKTAVS
jgi:adenylate cyclase